MNSLFFEEFIGPIFRENICFFARKLIFFTFQRSFQFGGNNILFWGRIFLGWSIYSLDSFSQICRQLIVDLFLGWSLIMLPTSSIFFIKNSISKILRNLTKNFSKIHRICTRKRKFSKIFPISLTKNSEISPEKKNTLPTSEGRDWKEKSKS